MARRIVLVNADIWPLDSPGNRAAALWIEGDRIAQVGEERAVLRRALQAGAAVVDLAGAKVLPGLIDSHTHLIHQGLLRHRTDLQGTATKEAALERVRRAALHHRGRGPLVTERWDESRWTRPHWPTRDDLDAITTRFPVIMRRVDGHVAVANTPALQYVKPRLPGVDMDRGLLVEDASLHLNRIWPSPIPEATRALEDAQRDALRLGVTTVHDFVIPHYLAAYRRLRRLGRLRLRAQLTPYIEYLPRLLDGRLWRGPADDHLWLGGVKTFTDGSIGGHTAALRKPYADDASNRGRLNWEEKKLTARVTRAARAGLQPSLHAIGDAAIDQVLAVYRRIPPRQRGRLRPRIEHFEIHTRDHVETARGLGIVLSMQPNFVGEWSLPGGLYDHRFGDARAHRNNQFRRILAAGARLAFGSDCMPLDPWWGLEAVARAPHPGQRLPIEAALRAYTGGSAAGLRREGELGVLRKGALADLVVVRGDWRRRGGLARTRVLATMVGGRWVHGKP